MISDSNSTHLRCALIIAAATHKWCRNQQLDLFQAFGISWPFQPAHSRKPLAILYSLYFAPNPPTTYSEFIHQYNCWTGLMECCSQQDQDTIHKLATGQLKWTYQNSLKSTSDLAASTKELSATQKMLKNFLSIHGHSTQTEE